MKAGRNDPCHCGSGRKYKKCCLARAESAALSHGAGSSPKVTPALPNWPGPVAHAPEPELNPEEAARVAFWARLDAADLDGRRRLLEEAMDQPDLVDPEFAFEVVNLIAGDSNSAKDQAQLAELIEQLRERCPDAYAAEEVFLLDWRMLAALYLGHDEEVARLAHRFAEIADTDVDVFLGVLDRLGFWGRLPVLADALRTAFAPVKGSKRIAGWVVEELGEAGIVAEILTALEAGLQGGAMTDELLRRACVYGCLPDPELLQNIVARIAGEGLPRLSLVDFGADNAAERTLSIAGLGWEFVGHLRRAEAMPTTRAVLAREEIVAYLAQRAAGELLPDRPDDKSRKKLQRPSPKHPLCPDQDSLGRYVSRRLNFINPKRYRMCALMVALPLWLEFLEERGLLGQKERVTTEADMRPLLANFKAAFEDRDQEPMLREAVAAL